MTGRVLPPGPEGHFLSGNLLDYKRDPLSFLTRCSWEYGDVVRLRFLDRSAYLLNNPEYIEYVLVKSNRNFVKGRARFFHRFRQEIILVGNSILASEGEFWRRQRRLCEPAFHRQRINAYGEVMVSFTERMLATWQDGENRDVHQEMMLLLLDIVTTTLFDMQAVKAEEVKEAFGRVQETLGGQGGGIQVQAGKYGLLLQFLRYLRFHKAVRQLNKVTYALINERRSSRNGTGDLLSLLLHFQDKDGNRMSDKQLRDEVVAMLFGGYETTANVLSWTWYLLSRHPEVETNLLIELQEVLGGRAPTVEDLPRLQYTQMVAKEAMRLYPPAWIIGREALEECEIGGYRITPGTHLLMSPWVMHRDPRYFEDPETFDPDRWKGEFAQTIPKYAYFPFGGGPRMCIGRSFATMQTPLVLATIAQRFQLELVSGQRMTPQPRITLGMPEGGIKVVLRERSSSAHRARTSR